MGRPRKKDRMSRMVQARVTDEQWNYLEYRAIEFHDGDLSAALREAILFSRELMTIVEAKSPPAALRELRERWQREYQDGRDKTYMDEPDE
jgi:hypothetical protein